MASAFSSALAAAAGDEEEVQEAIPNALNTFDLGCAETIAEDDSQECPDNLRDVTRVLVEQLGQLETRCILTGDKISETLVITIKHKAIDIAEMVASRTAAMRYEAFADPLKTPVENGGHLDLQQLPEDLGERVVEVQKRLEVAHSGRVTESRRADFWVKRAEALTEEVMRLRQEERENFGSATAKLRGLLNGECAESTEEQALLEWLRATEERAITAEADRDHAKQQLTVVEQELIEKMTRDTSDLRSKLDTAVGTLSEQRQEIEDKKRIVAETTAQMEEQQRQFADERATFWEELEEAARVTKAQPLPEDADTVASGGLDGPKLTPQMAQSCSSTSDPEVCSPQRQVPVPVAPLTPNAFATAMATHCPQRGRSAEVPVNLYQTQVLSGSVEISVQNNFRQQSSDIAGFRLGGGSYTVPAQLGPPSGRKQNISRLKSSSGSHTIPPEVVPPIALSPRVPVRSSEPWGIIKHLNVQSPRPLDGCAIQSPRSKDRAAQRAVGAAQRALSPGVAGPFPNSRAGSSGYPSSVQPNSVEVPAQHAGGSHIMVAPPGQGQRPVARMNSFGARAHPGASMQVAVAQQSRPKDVRGHPGASQLPPPVSVTPNSARLAQRPGSMGVPVSGPGNRSQALTPQRCGMMSPLTGCTI